MASLTLGENLLLAFCIQKLAGASLLIFANKQDIKGAMTPQEIARVRITAPIRLRERCI